MRAPRRPSRRAVRLSIDWQRPTDPPKRERPGVASTRAAISTSDSTEITANATERQDEGAGE